MKEGVREVESYERNEKKKKKKKKDKMWDWRGGGVYI